jgi:hypothetical protein
LPVARAADIALVADPSEAFCGVETWVLRLTGYAQGGACYNGLAKSFTREKQPTETTKAPCGSKNPESA